MKGLIYINPDDPATHKPKVYTKSPLTTGLSLPYVTKDGFPVIGLEGSPMRYPEWKTIDAIPGMVCKAERNDVYLIDADGEVQKLPIVIITEREYERLKHFEKSFPKETV